MSQDRPFGAFCLVGMGAHARTKLLPALQASGQVIAGVVSKTFAEPGMRVFAELDEALDALPRETVFFIASPPAAHYAQSKAILARGFDLFVEKPAFLFPDEAEEIAALADAQGAVLAEAMMYRHAVLYARLLDHWGRNRDRIRALALTFVIDRMPAGTFRLEDGMAASSTYDIGCYPVSLLADLGLGEAAIAVTGVDHPGARDRERVHAAGEGGTVSFTLDYGVAPAYANTVTVVHDGGETATFSPFFYGRPGERRIVTAAGAETVEEANSFETMLRRPRREWLAEQGERNRRMAAVTGKLWALASAVAAFGKSP